MCQPGRMQFLGGKVSSLGVPLTISLTRSLTILDGPLWKSAILPTDVCTHSRTEHDLHYRPLNKHTPWEPAVILELSCVFPVKPTHLYFLSPCCVLVVGCCCQCSSLVEHGLLPYSMSLPIFGCFHHLCVSRMLLLYLLRRWI
jgi:hypothetical protein